MAFRQPLVFRQTLISTNPNVGLKSKVKNLFVNFQMNLYGVLPKPIKLDFETSFMNLFEYSITCSIPVSDKS